MSTYEATKSSVILVSSFSRSPSGNIQVLIPSGAYWVDGMASRDFILSIFITATMIWHCTVRSKKSSQASKLLRGLILDNV